MTDYNVRADWPGGELTWVKALTSALYRTEGAVTTLPLSASVHEILDWVELASGPEAWAKGQNRASLREDLRQSAEVLGPNLRPLVGVDVAALEQALVDLDAPTAKTSLNAAPAVRGADARWIAIHAAGAKLTASLASDPAIIASWLDLVDASQNKAATGREFRPIADQLYAQIGLRRREPDLVFGQLRAAIAYGRSPTDAPWSTPTLTVDDRLAIANAVLLAPVEEADIVVWMGYLGGTVDAAIEAGNTTFMWAPVTVGNASRPDGQPFAHRDELVKIVEADGFAQPENVNDPTQADILVRVDLGHTAVAGAAVRAEQIAAALIDVSLHDQPGTRPLLAQTYTLIDGDIGPIAWRSTGFDLKDDHWGAHLTATALHRNAPSLGKAIAASGLPRYLAAALEAQRFADLPRSRERLGTSATDDDYRAQIPLEDRVVQHIAAYAEMAPGALFDLLARDLAAYAWDQSLDRAVRLCLTQGGNRTDASDELQRAWAQIRTRRSFFLFVTDRAKDLLAVCQVESERSWIQDVLASTTDPSRYRAITDRGRIEQGVLQARRSRVRNALVHGNPASPVTIGSVLATSTALAGYALSTGLESFTSSDTVPAILDRHHQGILDRESAATIADYWRAQPD